MEKALINLIHQLEKNLQHSELLETSISKSDVGWHITHSLLVINLVIDDLKNSDPKNYKPTFNLIRSMVFTFNKIPRGKGRAPKIVNPDSYENLSVQEQIKNTKEKIQQLKSVSPGQFFTHPFFGHMKKKKTVRFLKLHTKHHLKIIDEITKKA